MVWVWVISGSLHIWCCACRVWGLVGIILGCVTENRRGGDEVTIGRLMVHWIRGVGSGKRWLLVLGRRVRMMMEGLLGSGSIR